MQFLIMLSLLASAAAHPALLFAPVSSGIKYAAHSGPIVSPHPAVERNAANEAVLPRELLKSRDFYDNPAVAAGLAQESWFTNKEMQVVEREAEKIPRQRIYEMVKSAGYLDRH